MTSRLAALALTATLALAGCGSAPQSADQTPQEQAPASAPTSSAVGSDSSEAGSPAAGTGSPGATATDAQAMLAEHGLAGLDTRQVIEKLDTTSVAQRPTDLIASVRPDELLLSRPQAQGAAGSDGQAEPVSMPISGDNGFYLSVAPYESSTHECHFHSLTTCLGELRNAPVHVKVTGADGQVLVDEDTTIYDNGFVAVWLPRDISATLTITRDGKTATQPISTGPQDATCITTAQLA
ncbi:CueP family metal-binding protein [Piscicoccus intestinalis]|uniref:CueP family metal-binding protein n=1 Tax=Piscicoccus intestinalis TaxID=746033 RepID=UPI000A6AC8D3|nr:CueP family metal-binding protein [Piscicoccus intestinalis]